MQVIETKAGMLAYAHGHEGKIGFVPTMGYLHEGHLSLIRKAKAENELVVVSIFVNPAQFNDPADLEKYPVDMERDLAMLKAEGVAAVFTPSRYEIYPNGVPALKLRYDEMMQRLCGAYRPGHFEGVLLIVHNLFIWVKPARAYFGLKDYQQYLLIHKMVRDMSLELVVVGCPLIREKDGLALSSRNVRLSAAGRDTALLISRSLSDVKKRIRAGERNIHELKNTLQSGLKSLTVEYASLYDSLTLDELPQFRDGKHQTLIAIAAYVENVRLIDNVLIEF